MFNRIILLSGPVSSGKSTLAKGLAERLNMHVFKTSELLQDKVRNDLRTNRKILPKVFYPFKLCVGHRRGFQNRRDARKSQKHI